MWLVTEATAACTEYFLKFSFDCSCMWISCDISSFTYVEPWYRRMAMLELLQIWFIYSNLANQVNPHQTKFSFQKYFKRLIWSLAAVVVQQEWLHTQQIRSRLLQDSFIIWGIIAIWTIVFFFLQKSNGHKSDILIFYIVSLRFEKPLHTKLIIFVSFHFSDFFPLALLFSFVFSLVFYFVFSLVFPW